MKFVLPMAFSDPTHGCAMARAADACGWNAIAISDHVVHPERIDTPYPYTKDGAPRWEPEAPWPDPWVLIGAMSAVTTQLRFLTNVFVLPMRNPFVVAKAIGTAAVISNDRVALGIGMGWMREEFELLEQKFDGRGKRADEMIEVMRKLWQGGWVEHHGRHYDFPRLQMNPAPKARIPIYAGGLSDLALRRVGRLADGWISDLHTVDELREIIAKIRRYRAEYGREQEPLEVFASAMDAFDVDGYRRMRDAGVTHVLTMPWIFYGGSILSLDDKCSGIARFAEDIIANMP